MLQRKVTEDLAKRERRTVISTLLWFLFIAELFLFSIAFLVGRRGCGYKITFIVLTAFSDNLIEKKKVRKEFGKVIKVEL